MPFGRGREIVRLRPASYLAHRRLIPWRSSLMCCRIHRGITYHQHLYGNNIVLDALEQALWARHPCCAPSITAIKALSMCSLAYTETEEQKLLASTGSTGDSYDNAMAESINGLYKAEVIHRKSWKNRAEVELATRCGWTGITIDDCWEGWAILLRQKQKKLIMLPSETMIWQPEFTDKTLFRWRFITGVSCNHPQRSGSDGSP